MAEKARYRESAEGIVSRPGWARAIVAALATMAIAGIPLVGCSGGSSNASSSADSAASVVESSATVDHGKLVEIEATYDGPTKPGTVIDSKSDITVIGVYEDGTTEALDGWKVKKKVKLETAKDSTVTVTYKKLSTKITVTGDVPTEYLTALQKAQSYVDMMYMSKAALYDQLTSEYGEKYDAEPAQYAVEHVEADWKANALRKARDYRDQMAMSPSAIHDQLTSDYGEKFTQEEADYAIEHLDEDSAAASSDKGSGDKGDGVPREYETALQKAQSYVDMMHMSKAGLYDQLTSDYGERYSAEAAQYAVDNVDADWKVNALEKARDYRDTMNMSPDAIYDQLVSDYGEKFTAEEADYAIAHLDD